MPLDWRKISIALIDTDFGAQKAQSGENACLEQLVSVTFFWMKEVNEVTHERTHGKSSIQHPGVLDCRKTVRVSETPRTTTSNRTPAHFVAAFDKTSGTDVSCARGYVSRSCQRVRFTQPRSAICWPQSSPWSLSWLWSKIGGAHAF
jgi:hypothetical protein